MPPRSSFNNTDKAYKAKEGSAKEPEGSGKSAKGLITLVAGGTGIAAIANAGSRISQSKKRAATRAAGVKAGQDAVTKAKTDAVTKAKAKADAKTKARAVTKARTTSKATPKVVTPTAATPVKVEPLKITPEMRAKAAAVDSTKATEAFKKKFASALDLKNEVPKLSASEKSLIKKLHANPKLKLTAAQNTVVQRLKSAVKGGGANMSISDLTGMYMGGGNISSIPDDNPLLN